MWSARFAEALRTQDGSPRQRPLTFLAAGEVLAPRGVGLIIATDTDRRLPHSKVAVPPLPLPWPDGSHSGWLIGSAPPRSPIF
jgi:hypothetical protein